MSEKTEIKDLGGLKKPNNPAPQSPPKGKEMSTAKIAGGVAAGVVVGNLAWGASLAAADKLKDRFNQPPSDVDAVPGTDPAANQAADADPAINQAVDAVPDVDPANEDPVAAAVVPEDAGIDKGGVEPAEVSDAVNDNMSFDDAFAAARADVGPGGVFEWNGETYGTYYKEEWEDLNEDQLDNYWASVEAADVDVDLPEIDDSNIAYVEEEQEQDNSGPSVTYAEEEQEQDNGGPSVTYAEEEQDNDGPSATYADDNQNNDPFDQEGLEHGEIHTQPESGNDFVFENEDDLEFDDIAVAEQEGEQVFDLDEDGQNDAIGLDVDGDGNIDVVEVDTNADGQADIAYVDTDGNEVPDVVFSDTDGDGKVDHYASDSNEDGVIDDSGSIADSSYYASNDGGTPPSDDFVLDDSVDSVQMDLDGDGRNDAIGHDVDGDGYMDVLEIDTDGDGRADVAYADVDGDRVPDVAMADTNGDGQMDYYETDTNGDGIADESGTIDDSDYDDDSDTYADSGEDFDVDGDIGDFV